MDRVYVFLICISNRSAAKRGVCRVPVPCMLLHLILVLIVRAGHVFALRIEFKRALKGTGLVQDIGRVANKRN